MVVKHVLITDSFTLIPKVSHGDVGNPIASSICSTIAQLYNYTSWQCAELKQ